MNLHASYAETGGRKVERDALEPEHFQNWIEWAKSRRIGMDFNPTFFAHPLASDGYTLAHAGRGDSPVLDRPRHRLPAHRRRVRPGPGHSLHHQRLDSRRLQGHPDRPRGPARGCSPMHSTQSSPSRSIPRFNRDAVEGKFFGIGSESYVAGSHEFYFGYALSRRKLFCLDAGHYHPTEGVSDKISAVLLYLDEILLHVSRGVRWDSDHVVMLSDELPAIAQEMVRGDYLDRVHIGLDFFDASINRVAAWVIGARCHAQGAVARPARADRNC